MSATLFCLDFQVRDYECDIQGVVNNAVYQNYLEHARHEFLKQLGLDFAELVSRQINLVVIRAELDYKRSLRSGERFQIGIRLEKVSRLRFVFLQEIYRYPERELILKAKVFGAILNSQGRPYLPDEIASILDYAATVK